MEVLAPSTPAHGMKSLLPEVTRAKAQRSTMTEHSFIPPSVWLLALLRSQQRPRSRPKISRISPGLLRRRHCAASQDWMDAAAIAELQTMHTARPWLEQLLASWDRQSLRSPAGRSAKSRVVIALSGTVSPFADLQRTGQGIAAAVAIRRQRLFALSTRKARHLRGIKNATREQSWQV